MAWLRASFLLALGALTGGCFTARLVAPHQPYAAMLDHEGQLDIAVRAGAMDGPDTTIAGQVAYSPADGLELAASVDGDLSTEGNETAHIGGGIALGAYSRTDVFRAELLVGANGGTANGDGSGCMPTAGGCSTATRFGLSASYVQPFLQGLVGFEIPYFELAGGMRLFGYLADVAFAGNDGSSGRMGYERLYLEQILTIRVPIDVVRFEVLAAVPMSLGVGDSGPIPGSFEDGVHPYVVFGIGFQFDTMGDIEP